MSSTQKQLLISGVIQLVIGVFCVIFGIIERLPPGRYYMTMTSFPCLAIWMGLWIGITGLLGIFSKLKSSSKPLVGVYLGFSITSIVFAGIMIICYSLSLAFFYSKRGYSSNSRKFNAYVMSILVLMLSIIEFGIGIWACVCCCVTFSGQRLNTAPVGQVIYMQPQGGVPPASYVIVQGPDGRPVAVPAQTSGPMIVPGGTPTYSQQAEAALPPHYSAEPYQQPIQNQDKVPV